MLGVLFGLAFMAMGTYAVVLPDGLKERIKRRGTRFWPEEHDYAVWRVMGGILFLLGVFGVFTAIATG
jgi:hypothetical protein